MEIRTKCTISLCTLFLIELLPIPFTGIYAIYAMRKRPVWIFKVVNRLYADRPVDPEKPFVELSVEGHDFMKSRRNCTIGIVSLFIVDVIVPVIVPLGIYVVRKRPVWFKNVTNRLYADQVMLMSLDADESADHKPVEVKPGYAETSPAKKFLKRRENV